MPEFEELTETLTADGLEEEEVRDKAYLTISPKQRPTEYLSRSSTMHRTNEERPMPIHMKQIMKTKDAFVNDDSFDPKEALEAAVDKRKLLMKRLF